MPSSSTVQRHKPTVAVVAVRGESSVVLAGNKALSYNYVITYSTVPATVQGDRFMGKRTKLRAQRRENKPGKVTWKITLATKNVIAF